MKANCDDCDTPITEFTTKRIDKNLYDVGLQCPNCTRWYHSWYENEWLRNNKPGRFASLKDKNKYAKRFKAFQEEGRGVAEES